MALLETRPQLLSNLVAWELGGQNYYSRDLATSEGALALGDVVMAGTDPATQVKLAEAASTAVGVCLKAAADGEATIIMTRSSILKDQAINYGAGTEATLIADLEALGVLIRNSQSDYLFDV